MRGLAAAIERAVLLSDDGTVDAATIRPMDGRGDRAVDAPGLALWLRLAERVDARDWSGAAAGAGLTITDGSRFAPDLVAPPNAFRFGFANLDDSELTRAVSLLAASAPPRGGTA